MVTHLNQAHADKHTKLPFSPRHKNSFTEFAIIQYYGKDTISFNRSVKLKYTVSKVCVQG